MRHLGLARALLLEGDDERAESVTHDALKVLMDNGWRPGVIDALDVVAEVARGISEELSVACVGPHSVEEFV